MTDDDDRAVAGDDLDPVVQPRQLEMMADDAGVFVVHDPGPTAREEIHRYRDQGYGFTAIAAMLNNRGVPTPSGSGSWSRKTAEHHADPAAWAATIRRYRARRRDGPT